VTPEQFELLMEETAALIKKKLPEFFPDRDLRVVRDGKRHDGSVQCEYGRPAL
jgi:hypothetical protein